jgi:hypothetical protein
MADAATQALLQGAAAIELQAIGPGDAAAYLARTQLDPPPHGWQELTRRLRQEPGSPLARALNNPLMLTLVRDTYHAGDDVGELLGLQDAAGHPASSQDITGHLLDRVLPAAYAQQPGDPPPPYDLAAADRALRCIATRMNDDSTRDLQWWHVPVWAHAAPRVIATWLGAGLLVGLLVGLMGGLMGGPAWRGWGLDEGIETGIAAGITAGITFGRGNKTPKRAARVRWRQLFRRRPLVAGLLAGIVVWLVFGLEYGLTGGFPAGLVFGLMAWLGAGLVAGMSTPGTDNTTPISPLSSWRSDRAFGLVAGLVAGLVTGLVAVPAALPIELVFYNWQGGILTGVTSWLEYNPVAGLMVGTVAGLLVALVYPQSWSSSLAFAQLAASDRTPVRLMRFLEDARSRGVLRTVGPVYQFRHARLQDRLATPEPAAGHGPSEPRLAAGDAAVPTGKAPPASTR